MSVLFGVLFRNFFRPYKFFHFVNLLLEYSIKFTYLYFYLLLYPFNYILIFVIFFSLIIAASHTYACRYAHIQVHTYTGIYADIYIYVYTHIHSEVDLLNPYIVFLMCMCLRLDPCDWINYQVTGYSTGIIFLLWAAIDLL